MTEMTEGDAVEAVWAAFMFMMLLHITVLSFAFILFSPT